MSSKHPVTNDTVVFGSGRVSPDVYTSDYSGSGEQPVALVAAEWKRRPYHQTQITGGVTNPVFVSLQSSSPTHPVGDVDFDQKTSATYQELGEARRSVPSNYEDLSPRRNDTRGGGGEAGTDGEKKMGGYGDHETYRRSKCSPSFVCLAIVSLLALALACSAVAISVYVLLNPQEQEDKITELKNQLSDSESTIQQLNSTVDELTLTVDQLRRNLSESVGTQDARMEELSIQLEQIVNGTRNTVNNTVPQTVDLSQVAQECEYRVVETCDIDTTTVTTVPGAGSLPNYGSCFTSGQNLASSDEDQYIQDVYCAVTDFRSERNPVSATLHYDEDRGVTSCYCYVTALESRRGAVTCSMIVKYCPSIVEVSSSS